MTTVARWMPIFLVLGVAVPVHAQAPPAPPNEGWVGSVAAGLALTSGNSDTVTTNVAFTAESDKTKRNVFHAEGLNLRSSRDGDAIVDRTSLLAQDDYALTTRIYTFARLQYLRDVFKSIDYLLAPSGGLGYRFVNTMATSLTADIAVGSVTEKNPAQDAETTGAMTAGQKASHKLSSTATVTESFTALFKTSDFGDSLLTFQAGLATDITPRAQLKVDFLDTFKNRPPTVLVDKNDVALVMSFVFKF